MNICTMLIVSPGQVLSTTWAFLTAMTWAVLMYLGTICHGVAHVIHLDLKRPGLHAHEIIKFALLTNVIQSDPSDMPICPAFMETKAFLK